MPSLKCNTQAALCRQMTQAVAESLERQRTATSPRRTRKSQYSTWKRWKISKIGVQLNSRQASPFQKGVSSLKVMLHSFQAMLSPANIKLKIAEMQQMSFPELVVGFFKLFFYIFYYSGFGVATVLKWAISYITHALETTLLALGTLLECCCLWCVDLKLRSRWSSPRKKKK